MIVLNPTYMKDTFEHSVQIRDQQDSIIRWISVHLKQTKFDMELRAWEALQQKFGIHCL